MLIVNQILGDPDKILFSEHARDNACEPYITLREELSKVNISFESLKKQSIQDIDCVVYWDVDSVPPNDLFKRIIYKLKMNKSLGIFRDLDYEARNAAIKLKKILFLYEPNSVSSINARHELGNFFDLIFTWNSKIVDNTKYFKFYIPYSNITSALARIDYNDKKLLVDISSNKRYIGTTNTSSFRFEEIKHFDQKYGNDFDLYGAGWNIKISLKDVFTLGFRKKYYTRIQSYKGACTSKADILARYKFVLCYENTIEEEGFISVKIFDAFKSCCVPIYFGAPDIESFIPKSCFIDRRDFLTTDDLYVYLKNLSEAEHSKYLNAAAEFMNSKASRKFSPDYFAKNFIKVITHNLI